MAAGVPESLKVQSCVPLDGGSNTLRLSIAVVSSQIEAAHELIARSWLW